MLVKPVTTAEAAALIRRHPHAPMLPAAAFQSRQCFAAYERGTFVGLAVWGWGVNPRKTPQRLFGVRETYCYRELNRFFVINDRKNRASQFLATTHRIIRKHMPQVEWVFTYAAGFQGMVGTIYQAAGYLYLGRRPVQFFYVPGYGLIHTVSIWHRYGRHATRKSVFQTMFPGARVIHGYNFEYLYILRNREAWLERARFQVVPRYPTKDELEIVDDQGKRYDPEWAKAHLVVMPLPMRRSSKIRTAV